MHDLRTAASSLRAARARPPVLIGQATANRIEVRVADDGPGIDTGALPHIFERFMRADTARSHTAGTTGTTGLGLPITEAIVHAHRGTIGVTSQPGRTTFTIGLPGSTAQHGDGSTL